MSEFFLRPEDPPRPEQIESFARSCILFAHRHGQLRRHRAWYKIGPMARYAAPDVVEGEPYGFLYEDALKVYASLGPDATVNVIHTVAAREISAVSDGAIATELRTFDKFQVRGGEVVRSSRELEQTIGGTPQFGVDALDDINLDNVRITDDAAEMLAWEDDCRLLSAGDFDVISQDVTRRMKHVDDSGVFSEKRRNYFEHFS